jgi:cyclase
MPWNRRQFIRLSALGIVAGAMPGPLLAAGTGALHSSFGRRLDPLRELRRNVGTFTGRGGTMGWMASPDGALVVDSQFPDTARVCLDALEARPVVLPLDVLVNTHHHGDHTGGNPVFRDAVRQIVAHERVPELQRRAATTGGSEAAQVYADTTFGDEWRIRIGDETIRARHYGPAHTAGDCTVLFEQANVVHMGDLIFNRFFPFIDRAGGASIRGWIELLETVSAEHDADTIYVFGHGQDGFGVTGSRADLLLQRDLLTALLDTARRAVAEGRDRDQLAAMERLEAFPDHVPVSPRLNLGLALGTAWGELTGDV